MAVLKVLFGRGGWSQVHFFSDVADAGSASASEFALDDPHGVEQLPPDAVEIVRGRHWVYDAAGDPRDNVLFRLV